MAVSNGNRESTVKNTSAVVPSWINLTWATADSPAPPTVAAGDLLLIVLSYANNIALNHVRHDGDDLTRAGGGWLTSAGLRQEYWYITAPASGLKEITVQFASAMFNGVSVCAMCFAGASGIGVLDTNDISATPHTQSITVSEGSMVYATMSSTGSHTSIAIDGTTILPANFEPNQVNVNKIVSGAWTTSSLSAGSIDVVTSQPTGSLSNSSIEILATVAPPVTGATGNFLMMFR